MAEERVQRRLTAILAADVVGYSRLMQQDEAGTLSALKSRRSEVLQPLVSKYHGRIFKLMGDGVLVEFASAVNAIQCAIDLQQAMAAANADLPENRRIVLRIGVNLGDVIVEGDDLYGDGVNIAARLEEAAEPGGIWVSGSAYDQVRNKVEVGFEGLGSRTLKNMAEPVRVYRARPDREAKIARPALTVPDKPSIAVLPFTNMSGDSEQEYFADGMVEEITTALSRFRNLFVIARNSSFSYKGRAVEVKQVGRELGVRYVLEGSVRKGGERLRITTQLIDTATGAHIWADRFDGAVADVFDLQDTVTTRIVGTIAPRLEASEIERARLKPTEDLSAYDYYLRGLAATNRRTRDTCDTALQLFYNAIERDPHFALAYAEAANCYNERKMNGWMVDRDHEIGEAVHLARRAIEIGRDDAVALTYGALVLCYMLHELDDCAPYVDRAIALNSNFAMAWSASGWMKICYGDPDAGIEHQARAMRLSPFDPRMSWWQTATALAHTCAGRYEEAVSWAEKALQDQPGLTGALRMATVSHALAGRTAEAQRMMARLRQADPRLRVSNLDDVMPPFRRQEDHLRIIEGLRKAGLPE
ncbi:MAG TPA: adenylate/guanylate cyclase domain-containing protein [Candidatus Cybelea sp.]|nr:adenylate/guanylate cyclase domain-containing protein [Candidatus Cybelea sp.]